MIKRPNNKETFDDVLKEQSRFDAENAKNPSFAAATVVSFKKENDGKKSVFARNRMTHQKNQSYKVKCQKDLTSRLLFDDVIEINSPSENSTPKPSHVTERSKQSIYGHKFVKAHLKNNTKINSIEELQTQKLESMKSDMSFENYVRLMKQQRGGLVINATSFSPTDNAAINILQHKDSNKWLNFDKVESEKLEWLTSIPETGPLPKPGEQYEARFDWNGMLMPFNQDKDEDQRHLYLHGDEPQRPGYTLQELFRLARSNVLQQRIAAFSAIKGLLSIYQQGYYDNVMELPLSKIFFLLRLGFDENVPSILVVVAEALSQLFYNECDEIVLDLIFDNAQGHWQPLLEVREEADTTDEDGLNTMASLQQQMSKLLINKSTKKKQETVFKTGVDDTEEDEGTNMDTMTDFHLAETDLIACLLRTNILERIYYILNTLRPQNSTVHCCLKILIRLARTGRNKAVLIAKHDKLMHCLHTNFFNDISTAKEKHVSGYYGVPQALYLKLLRVLAAYGLEIVSLLEHNLNMDHLLHSYFHMEGNFYMKVQIEAFRLLRTFYLLNLDEPVVYERFLNNLCNMLDWHLLRLDYTDPNYRILREHAAALLQAIVAGTSSGKRGFQSNAQLIVLLHNCCCKWFFNATKNGVKEISQMNLLSACLSASIATTRNLIDIEAEALKFQQKYLIDFIQSKSFLDLLKELSNGSLLLSPDNDRRFAHKALPNVGAVIVGKTGAPHAIMSIKNPIYFLDALFSMCEVATARRDLTIYLSLFKNSMIVNIFKTYLENLSHKLNLFVATNIFARVELKFVLQLLNYETKLGNLKNTQILQLANRLALCLSSEFIPNIEHLFQNIIFNKNFLPHNTQDVQQWTDFYMEHIVFPHMIIMSPTELSLTKPAVLNPVLSADWPYYPLRRIFHHYVQNSNETFKEQFSEKQLIEMCLLFAQQLDTYLNITPTQKLIYFMMMFMGPDSVFLEPNCAALLRVHLLNFFKQMKGLVFDFETYIPRLPRFETIYYMFVDHFQASSYGNDMFSALILVPLAQNYDAKYRKRLWSDMSAALTYVRCNEDLLINGLEAYLYPIETDESMLAGYMLALQNNSAAFQKSIVYQIALHHVQSQRSRSQTSLTMGSD